MNLTDLTTELNNATLSPEEAAALMKMIDKKRKIATVERLHTNKICERRDGRLYTSIGDGKKLTSRAGETREDFLLRLYDSQYAEAIKCLDSIWNEFFESYKPGRADETWHNAEVYFNHHIKGSRLATMPLRDITNGDVDDFFDEISARYCGIHPAKFYGKLRTVLNAMFRYASRKRYISYLPYSADFTDIATRFKQQTPAETWSLGEYEKLLSVIDDNDPYERCLHLQTLIGCRTGEILALQFDDMTTDQFDRPVLRIHAHNATKITQDEDGAYHKRFEKVEGTKGRRRRGIHDIPLGDEAAGLIEISRSQSVETSGYVFQKPDGTGEPLFPTTYNLRVKKLCERAGVPYHSNYAARRLVVSRLQTSNNHYELMRVMGWSSDCTGNYAAAIDDSMYDRVTA
ncbi:MAG: site-specific integrase, partial [Lachnospiraceae bacterium]|nr:site-specific integrase [Lachnospiraceae bacterium]